jgi:hypothetical protein
MQYLFLNFKNNKLLKIILNKRDIDSLNFFVILLNIKYFNQEAIIDYINFGFHF